MKIKIALTLLALGASAFIVNAQDAGGPPPNGGGPGGGGHCPPPDPVFTALDTNHDGVIDSNEIAGASAALKTLDKNGDGQLTTDEYQPARPAQTGNTENQQHQPPPSPVINALDKNSDGVISASEIANAPAALLTLDKNGDGQLTRDELRPPPPSNASNPPGDEGN
jgi:Ca2+-binding EF-hand superfamily protein